ncbi:methyltransferase family protein [Spartinivicinus poritis]|uniref:methyltransferase family protein n=1 Tax=Spartinivicinus poritis TaxID=2994640 RepID=UPI003CC913E5
MMNRPLDEHPFNHKGQFICLSVFLITWIADSFVFQLTTFYSQYIPIWFRIIIFILTILSVVLIIRSAIFAFPENQDVDSVISHGVFNYLRHPMYFSCIILYLGLSLSTASLIALFLILPIFVFYNQIADYEESSLAKRLGNPYLVYKQRSSRWLPKKVKNNIDS